MLSNLNQPQQEAVNNTQGPLLVLAGAGTGKTKVLTSRIINIVNSYLASPQEILAVTFTNKAASEMRLRIQNIVGDQVNNMWIATFHSIAAKILRRHSEIVGLKSDFIIIDQDDQLRLIKQILADYNIDNKQFPAKNYLNKISKAKDINEAQSLINLGDNDAFLPKLSSVYQNYQYRLRSMNSVDFGDLLNYNLEIFSKSNETLLYYQNKFKYILVDEYQDTNNIQYQWLLKLSALNKNICAVGDDDQSIYSWRGANIANILRFEKDFNNAKIIRLEQNYRSSSAILDAAHSVIANNKQRHSKKLWTTKSQGEEVKLYSFNDDRNEANFVVEKIEEYLKKSKYKASEISILVRAGYQTRVFEEALIRSSLPYKIIGGMKFYERMEIKDAICYLRIIFNKNDDLALNRIINLPKRGIGETTISNIYQKSKDNKICLYDAISQSIINNEIKGRAKDGLISLISQIENWKRKINEINLSDLASIVLKESGYLGMWQLENSLEAQGRLENIEEFVNSLSDFSTITEFLEYVSLVETKEENFQESINIMTVHAAKGLEFDLVFIPGLEDGVFPSSRSIEEKNGVEEERRLLYVAITRAKQELILCYAKTRFVFGDYQQSLISRFINELPDYITSREKQGFENNILFDKKNFTNKTDISSSGLFGKRIFHQKFGYGKVVSVDGAKLEINFEKTGKKTVMQDFISLA